MAITNNLGITLIEQNQAQKEITANQGFSLIDAIMNIGVVDKDLVTPPVSPLIGDVYIIAPSATSGWSGKDNDITWFDQVWKFLSPNEGMTLWVNDEDQLYTWNGTIWVKTSSLNGITDNATVSKITINDSSTVVANDLIIQSTFPVYALEDTDAAIDEKIIRFNTNGGVFAVDLLNDAFGAGINAFKILRTGTTVDKFEVNTDLSVGIAGKGLKIMEGANSRMGAATLASGTATVSNTTITANTRIFLTSEGTSTGVTRVSSRTVGTNFVITSTDATSSDIVYWFLVEPA